MSSHEVEMRSVAQHQARIPEELHDDEDQSHGDEEQSSLLSVRDRDGTSRESPPSLSKDLAICIAAWSRLSGTTRSVLVLFVGVLLVIATYEFGVHEGVREQENDANKHKQPPAVSRLWKTFGKRSHGGNGGGISRGDGDDLSGTGLKDSDVTNDVDPPPPGTFTRTFSKEVLSRVRSQAMRLIFTLNEYYGGEEKARSMLVKSWQAHWQLDEDFILLDEADDDSDDDVDNDVEHYAEEGEYNDADENKAGNQRRETKVNRSMKRDKKKKDKSEGDHNKEAEKEEKKKKKNKGPKVGKVLEDLDGMSPEQLEQHHHHKRQRTNKLVMTMARALLNPNQSKFIIGTIGSSVAAGHDNCHYDSYESQLERTLAPVLAAANMATVVQNAGEGGSCGDNHQNQVFCISHNVSPDVDIIHYSWTYFEKDHAELARENLIRWAQNMERRPMVHHLHARGKMNTCMGDDKPTVDMAKAYASYGYNTFCIQTGLYFGGHDYEGELEEGINRFGWQNHGDGYHNTTRYGEELPDDDPRKISLGTVYRNWHPGPLGFQIAADAFAYVYTKGLMLALDIIEKDMNAGTNIMDRWFDAAERRLDLAVDEKIGYTRKLRSVSPDHKSPLTRQLYQLPPLGEMPEPLFCDPVYCSVPNPPSCLNFEKPTFGQAGIALKSLAGWQISHDENKWNKMVGKVDIKIIKEMHSKEWEMKCKHLDACGGAWAQDSTAGALTFALPSSNMTAGLVFVCGYGPKNPGLDMFILNKNLTIKLNGQKLEKSNMDVYPTKKCARIFKSFAASGYEKEDSMLLSFEMAYQEPDLEYSETPPLVRISHVVAV